MQSSWWRTLLGKPAGTFTIICPCEVYSRIVSLRENFFFTSIAKVVEMALMFVEVPFQAARNRASLEIIDDGLGGRVFQDKDNPSRFKEDVSFLKEKRPSHYVCSCPTNHKVTLEFEAEAVKRFNQIKGYLGRQSDAETLTRCLALLECLNENIANGEIIDFEPDGNTYRTVKITARKSPRPVFICRLPNE